MQSLPNYSLAYIIESLPLKDACSLREVDKACNQAVLRHHTSAKTIHDLWESYAPNARYALRRIWIKWTLSVAVKIIVVVQVLIWAQAFLQLLIPLFILLPAVVVGHNIPKFNTRAINVLSHLFNLVKAAGRSVIMSNMQVSWPSGRGNTYTGGAQAKEVATSLWNDFDPFKRVNRALNIFWILCGGPCLSILQLAFAAINAATIIGLPAAKENLIYAGIFLWPFGWEYHLQHSDVPPKDPRLSGMCLFKPETNHIVRLKLQDDQAVVISMPTYL